MANITPNEKEGLLDFIQQQGNDDFAISLAQVITNNSIRCHSVSGTLKWLHLHYRSAVSDVIIPFADAIDTILLHSTSIQSILNRKLITKSILFRYLHSKRVPITEAVTKQALIDKLLEYWTRSLDNVAPPTSTTTESNNAPPTVTSHSQSSHFPIHEMSRSFAKWFFDNLNTGTITVNDFWSDVACDANFYENKCVMLNETATSSVMVHRFLLTLRTNYQLFLNLNDCFDGVQGRIDPHGLVLVLSCGTLHKAQEFVGTFEAVFGLLRDPFAQNNWKIKQIRLKLHNSVQRGIGAPTLRECEAMQPLLCLETPACTIEEID